MINLYHTHKTGLFLLVTWFLLAPVFFSQAQVVPNEFGKNRIQYKKFNWVYLSSQNFNVYYYDGGKATAQNTIEYAEKELKRITSLIGYFPYSKTTLILYNSVADLRQSNIGLNDDSYRTGGETLFIKNKIELAFEGTQTEFRKSLSLQVTQLLLNDMMYGGSLREVLQSSYMLRLPEWFLNGAAAYIAEGWNMEMDNYMRDVTAKIKNKKPEAYFVRNPQLAGQSVWNYISERYGYTSIQNILNLTRITRDIEVGIASSLNVPYKKFLRDWQKHYIQMNTISEPNMVTLEKNNQLFNKNRRNAIFTQPTISPNGNRLAYVENDRGRYEIKVVDLNRKRTRQIKKGGYRTPDQTLDFKAPLLTWKSNDQLNIIEIKRAQPKASTHYFNRSNFNLFSNVRSAIFGDNSRNVLSQFSQVVSIDYSEDGRMLVLSAVKNGQSDLFLFRGNSRQPEQLTNDIYDDKNVTFLKGSNKLVFSSNRWRDTAATDGASFKNIVDNYDLFTLDLDRAGARPRQITSSISNEFFPVPEDDQNILYLSEESGIRSVYRYNLTSKQSQKVTTFLQNIKAFDYSPVTKRLVFVAADRNKEFVYYFPEMPLVPVSSAFKTVRQTTLEDRSLRPKRPVETKPTETKAAETAGATPKTQPAPAATDKNINTQNYEFDAEQKTADKPVEKPKSIVSAPAPQPETLAVAGPLKYDLRFSINKVISSMYQDNLMGFGLLAEVDMSDMFEDHRINGGAFILTDLKTSNFYAEYSNLKRRYDINVSFQKQTLFRQFAQTYLRYARQEFTPAISYPLSHSVSVRVLPKLLHTRYSITNFLAEPDSVDMFASVGGEFVFDNSVATGINMMEGTRMKVGYSAFREFEQSGKNFNRFYVDLRHYQKLHRQIILASRINYGHYFGNAPKRYLLGGVDSWLFRPKDDDVEESERIFHNQAPVDYFYQQFATPMRGFKYNARRGSKVLLFNAELRVPIVQYLFQNATLGSGFFRNLQLTAFSDVGSAYSGSNPFSRKNSFNTQVLGGVIGDAQENPFEAIVVNYRNPFLYGYGLGARTTLLGVYGKLDVAWGEENFQRSGPKVYLSLGYDF